MPAYCQIHPPTGAKQFLGDLAPGRARTDNEHRALRQTIRITVLARVSLLNLRREA
jgi:hypothetical protein